MSTKWVWHRLWIVCLLAVSIPSAHAVPSVILEKPPLSPGQNGENAHTARVGLIAKGDDPNATEMTLGGGLTLTCQSSETEFTPKTVSPFQGQEGTLVNIEVKVPASGTPAAVPIEGFGDWPVPSTNQCTLRVRGSVANAAVGSSGSGADFTLGSGGQQETNDDVWFFDMVKSESDDCPESGSAPTEIASLPISGPGSFSWTVGSSSIATSTAAVQEATLAHGSRRIRNPVSADPPRWWVQDRGPGYMTSLIAPVRFENGTLNVYYDAHAHNGMEMQTVPTITMRDVAAPELRGSGVRGVVEIDLWEDEQIHSVKLWLSDGSVVGEGPLVERIRARVAVDYGREPRRHRLIHFQGFETTAAGELRLVGNGFSYQPLCGCQCEYECQPQ